MVRRTSRIAAYVGALLLFWTIAAPSADAYIDPGSSSFIIQILVGGAMGAALAIATFWRRIRTFLSRVFGKGRVESPPSSTPNGATTPATPDSATTPPGDAK